MCAFTFSLPKQFGLESWEPWKELPTEEKFWKGQSPREQKPRGGGTSSVNLGTSACWLGVGGLQASRPPGCKWGDQLGTRMPLICFPNCTWLPQGTKGMKGVRSLAVCMACSRRHYLSSVHWSPTPEGSKELTSLTSREEDPTFHLLSLREVSLTFSVYCHQQHCQPSGLELWKEIFNLLAAGKYFGEQYKVFHA